MKAESQVKQEQIVAVALRRFSHFGIAKTTMTEIAEDMAVSKQVLSYYFTDKQSLINAVIEKLTMDYISQLQAEMDTSATVLTALLKLTEVKGIFFEKYFILAVQAEHVELAKSTSPQNWRKLLTEKELVLVISLLEKGMRSGELKPLDVRKTGELLLDTLYAFSRCVKEKGVLPDAEVFREVMTRQQEVIRIFYQGLKAAKWVN